MLTEYVNPSKPQDFCERASNFLLAPAMVAAGRKVDVKTALKLPQEHILARAACAAFATLLFPVTLLGLALQYKSFTHTTHTLTDSAKFRPVALVVSKPNRQEVEQRMLGDVQAACRDIGGSEPHVIEWESGAAEFSGIGSKNLFKNYTVIFLQQATACWRLYRCFQHDGYFSSVPRGDVQNDQTFAINHHTPNSGYPSNKSWEYCKDNKEPDTYVTRTYSAIPTVVWNILNTARSTPSVIAQ